MPNDDWYLINYSEEEKENIYKKKYPKSENIFKRILWAQEFINNKKRYCLRLDRVSPSEYKEIPPIMEAIKNVKRIERIK